LYLKTYLLTKGLHFYYAGTFAEVKWKWEFMRLAYARVAGEKKPLRFWSLK